MNGVWKQVLIFLASLAFFGCARSPLKDPTGALRSVRTPSVLKDSGDIESLHSGLKAHAEVLKRRSSTAMRFGDRTVASSDYAQSLDFVIGALAASNEEKAVRLESALREGFDFFEIYGERDWGDAFVTGYFQPQVEASPKPRKDLTAPLYSLPKDLVQVDFRAYREAMPQLEPAARNIYDQKSRQWMLTGRLAPESNTVLPFYSRKEIEAEQKLKGRGLEMYWLDPVDAFFLHIQGSGVLKLPGGKTQRVGYAGQNGHSYVPVGRLVQDQIPLAEITQPRLEAHLRSLPQPERQQILWQNPSFVFFRKLEGEALTSIGAPVVAERTVAADPAFFPKGALIWVEYDHPEFDSAGAVKSWRRTSRLMMDQDSGGAIRGPHRFDLYFGEGPEAQKVAGVMKGRAKVFYLAPKKGTPALEGKAGAGKGLKEAAIRSQ